MKSVSPLKRIVGKTVKSCEASKDETADSCSYASVIFQFTDGSQLSLQFRGQPQLNAQFFADDTDEGADEEKEIVKPC